MCIHVMMDSRYGVLAAGFISPIVHLNLEYIVSLDGKSDGTHKRTSSECIRLTRLCVVKSDYIWVR